MSEPYKVQLDSYNGPLDLLLFLIRQEEVDIYDIPIARLTAQYLEYVDLLKQLDPNNVGEFLVMSATLMEIKSRTLLPRPPQEDEDDEIIDPRLELVRQLLEYKKFKDAATQLESAADERAARFERSPAALSRDAEPEVDLEDVQVWDLLQAFGKLLRQIGLADRKHEVVYDDTPIALHAGDIIDRLQREGNAMTFEQIFQGRPKGEIIGLFLALLELIRAKRVRAEQGSAEDHIVVHLIDAAPLLEADIQRSFADPRWTNPDSTQSTAHEQASDTRQHSASQSRTASIQPENATGTNTGVRPPSLDTENSNQD